MSETLSQDPDNLGSGYSLAASYPPTPATPSSTVQEVVAGSNSNLPPFSTFAAEMDTATGYPFTADARLLDISAWDYYGETRLLERTENGLSVITSQPQYRPWESKPQDSSSQESLRHSFAPISTFADAFAQNGVPKLPSFQSQFQTFNEHPPASTTCTTGESPTLTTLTNLTPVSPNANPASPNGHLTTLNSNFHTLSAVNARNYPLVPAPIQAREIPSIQQQYLDERHIQLYTHPTTSLTTLGQFPTQNGTLIQNSQIIATPTVVTVIKSEPDLKIQNLQNLHPTQFQNPMVQLDNGYNNGLDKKLNGMESPSRNDFRKKERRKIRASSLESSAESDGASSNMEMASENSGQVASISSTAGFKGHHVLTGGGGGGHLDGDEISGGNADKQVKKKRKRCGECIGCQRKDNCGDCAPCRNDKSHQICKQRRCEKLTEKKLYGDDGFIRGDSRRGRGKGRGSGSYRGRKPTGPVSLPSGGSVQETSGPPPSRPSPQPVHMIKQEPATQQQPMTPMPFYADPNRFPTPVWQADPTQGWTQGQFIQQIPATPQAGLEGYTQQYTNGIYPATFDSNTFYTGMQVLTSTRPPSAPNQTQLTPRPNGTYSHSPSPVSFQTQQQQQQQQQQNQQANQRTNMSGQYQQQEYNNTSGYAPSTTPTGVVEGSQQQQQQQQQGNLSRPSSVNSAQNFQVQQQQQQQQQQQVFTPISSANFSPGSSGNGMPGYPPVSSHPQLVSHNFRGGYPGEVGGSPGADQHPWQPGEGTIWDENAKPDELQQQFNAADVQQSKSHEIETTDGQFSQSDRVHLNSRLKTMILNKQQQQQQQLQHHQGENKLDDSKSDQNKTGHFLWYSHHHRLHDLGGGGGVPTKPGLDELIDKKIKPVTRNLLPQFETTNGRQKEKTKQNLGFEIPDCKCLPPNYFLAEPGSYYTHLGCSDNLTNLRKSFEERTGVSGKAIRMEKIRYTGKEGKTKQGCPIAKWIIRRSGHEEKLLIVVKHRPGHFCQSAFIVVCIVAWEGVSQSDSNTLYNLLTTKLDKFGLPTNRRCASNDPRTCACQGLNPSTCGASFSFGCSWSMYYNGCKYTRSKAARKFRLSAQEEEKEVEEKLQALATHVSPLYQMLAPDSFKNQCEHEDVATECRLGKTTGRPFSGVTACLDFCAHSHKDIHNMSGGCTVVVTLTKHHGLTKAPDEQLHVLPLYVPDGTDEFGSKEDQDKKCWNGSVECLQRYTSEVRVRNMPQEKCRRNRKRKENRKTPPNQNDGNVTPSKLIQSNQVSTTVLDKDVCFLQSRSVFPQHNTALDFSLPSSSYNEYMTPKKFERNDGFNWYSPPNWSPNMTNLPFDFSTPQPLKTETLGYITETTDNSECFRDSRVGGVAIALSHGSVLFECAKHEVHATTALKTPDRRHPTRISLVFYQHRNLNKSNHGFDEYEEKLRLRKYSDAFRDENVSIEEDLVKRLMIKTSTITTVTVTTLFPTHPCIVTGNYQETARVY